jgi:maleate isomerase
MELARSNAARQEVMNGDWPVIKHRSLLQGKMHRPAIGLLELSTEIVMQAEIRAFLPDCDHGIYTSRVQFGDAADVKGLAEMEAHLHTAASLLPDPEWLDAIVFGCTSGSMVIGPQRVSSLLSAVRPAVPVFNPISAVVTGLVTMNTRRVAVVTPYPQETNHVVRSFLKQHGIDVVSAVTFDILSGYEMSRLSPQDIYSAALQANTDEAESIFISCTALNVSPILEDLERETGKPVVASNQALAWQCCEIAGVRRQDGRGGALFRHRYTVPQ